MTSEYSFLAALRRLYWDMRDPHERKYYLYHLVLQLPGLFGSILRVRFLAKHCKRVGHNVMVLQGARFRSIENLSVGDGVSIGDNNYIQAYGNVTLGNNVMLAPGVKIWSVNHGIRSRDRGVHEQGLIPAPIEIGNDVFIGMDSIILPGVALPEGCIVTAGSIVGVKAYPAFSIISGNPARVIGHRE